MRSTLRTNTQRGARRRVVLTLALSCCSVTFAAPPHAPPLRNLVVEMRQIQHRQPHGAAVIVGHGAQVTLGTRGAISGRAGVVWEAHTDRQDDQATQRVVVMNTGQALMRAGLTRPMQWYGAVEIASSNRPASAPAGPGARIRVEPNTWWMDTGQSWMVRPLWPGGGAPVRLEIQAYSSRARDPGLTAGDGASAGAVEQHSEILTTVQVPLGQWVTVASTAQRRAEPAPQTLRSDQAAPDEAVDLQVKVSLQD